MNFVLKRGILYQKRGILYISKTRNFVLKMMILQGKLEEIRMRTSGQFYIKIKTPYKNIYI